MVHNGIEYGDMQLIAKAYDVPKSVGKLSNEELRNVFSEWNKGELLSFLIEITADIFGIKDDKGEGCVCEGLIQAICGLTFVYVLLGLNGHLAYGDQSLDIVTLNLPQCWSSMVVQFGLCMGTICCIR
ncbi:hypothetical protein PVL29_002410 [Vitis rotundifolia]|uniref:phosphogluconate dehydrogenase (NADP(+)-dependent, decarboxylating) n=1 Tax=Vitis rotundifolia TaxID=103349 RepID=A0AA39AGU5_VITRO|nr:hypothetical protein PVL29_002410 [Vitis rotundifolia]